MAGLTMVISLSFLKVNSGNGIENPLDSINKEKFCGNLNLSGV